MKQESVVETPAPSAARPLLPLLLLLFAGSGCSALIYEIVWCQLLQLVIGSSAVSLGVLLGTFMGGMCLGSLLLPRLLSPRLHPLRVYALIEIGIGVFGLVVLFALPAAGDIYTEATGSGLQALLMRGALCAVFLLPPTMLMGATLPAIARWVEATPQGVSWLGFFYGGNLAGAVFGCLLAGFYLLRVHDMAIATYVAVSVNAAVAVLSLGMAVRTAYDADEEKDRKDTKDAKDGKETRRLVRAWPVFTTIALSGATALAAEVIWTRLLSLLLGATVYTFSIILAVFLVGLGIGSSIGAALARASRQPGLLLAGCQLLLGAAIAWTGYTVASSLPYWPINPNLTRNVWDSFQLDLVRCFWAVLPATCLWGASFPLALAAGANRGQDPGHLVGATYAANTVGAIIGAVAASLVLIRLLGTQDAQRVLIGVSALAALVALAPSLWRFLRAADFRSLADFGSLRIAASLALITGILGSAAALAWSVPEVPWELVAYGRFLPTREVGATKLYMGEGMNSSVAVTELTTGVRNFHVSGKIEASSEPQDMRLQRMLGHIPALYHPKPQSVLVVGCGAGVTAGSFMTYPEVEHVVICEIEPLVPEAVAPHFIKENYDVVHDPRVEIVYDDARHYVLTTPRRFDIITSDPIHPWVKGSATLYTREYFELCKRHLNPGGLITQWVPLYESSEEVVKSEIATFFEVFPHGTIWCNDNDGEGYDLVLLGQVEPLKIDADAIQERIERSDHAAVQKSLENVGFRTVVGVVKTYGGQACDLAPWLEGAQINRDRNLRLQYLAGLQLNTDQSKLIHEAMMSYRRIPENLLNGTGWHSRAVRLALEHSLGGGQKSTPE
jgi:spermidine synthase